MKKISLIAIAQRVKPAHKKQYVVQVNGRNVGMVEKLGPFPGEIHPWKAFAEGVEPTSKMHCVGAIFLGSTYNGQKAAVDMVVNYKGPRQ